VQGRCEGPIHLAIREPQRLLRQLLFHGAVGELRQRLRCRQRRLIHALALDRPKPRKNRANLTNGQFVRYKAVGRHS
jgi:hypothetical protein